MKSAIKIDYHSSDEDLPRNGEVRGQETTVEDLMNPLRKRQVKHSSKSSPKYHLEDENVDMFSQKFNKEIRNMNGTLDLIEDAYEKNRNCFENSGVDEKKVFTNFGEEIHELEQYLTASTRFLPDFKVKTCQKILSNLTNRYNEVRSRVMPKKKFGFNSRKKKEVVPSKLVADEKDLTDHGELYKEKVLKEKCIVPSRTSDLSLDITDLCGKYICEKGNRINKHDITINDLKNCFVEIRGQPGSIRVKNLINCVILCGPTSFSVYGENCHQTSFAISCHQFRLHFSTSCSMFLHVTSRAIIEECHGIEVGCYNYKYEGLEQDFKDAGLDTNTNNYADVADFDWLSPDAPSPNWHLSEKTLNWDELRQKFIDKVHNEKTP